MSLTRQRRDIKDNQMAELVTGFVDPNQVKENTSYTDLDSVTDFVEDGVGVVKVDRDDAGLHLQATWQSLYHSGK